MGQSGTLGGYRNWADLVLGLGEKKAASRCLYALLYLLSAFHLRHFECLWSEEESSKVRKSKKTNKGVSNQYKLIQPYFFPSIFCISFCAAS
jgi:hypothetical protein